MAPELQIFDFVLGRARTLVLPGQARRLDRRSAPISYPAPATGRLIRLDGAGRRLVEDHLKLLAAHRRQRGRDAG